MMFPIFYQNHLILQPINLPNKLYLLWKKSVDLDCHNRTFFADLSTFCPNLLIGTGLVGSFQCLQMLMHLLFLGVAESDFTLSLDYLKSIGSGENTFKVRVQNLLHQLRKFNLSWLLAHPFSGKTP